MSHIKLLLLLASLSCLSLQCKKEEDEIDKLPPATSYGAGTFGCLINGKAWPIETPWIESNYHDGILYIRCFLNPKDPNDPYTYDNITLCTNKIHKPGQYFISYKNFPDDWCVITNKSGEYASYTKTNQNPENYFYYNITRLDSINRIVSGTFSFAIFDAFGTSSARVSDGRFDLYCY
ncbi:MAG: hypothetical protein IT247_03445 [Bacteroidia bacterium]|nr:hypothetical protein [Bacteroidia bacterium]